MPLGLHISTARVQAGRGWDRELDAFGFSNLMLDNADFWVTGVADGDDIKRRV